MSRQIFWFILNAGSWILGLGGLIYAVAYFETADTVMQQIAYAAYGSVFVLFAMFLRMHATDIRRVTTK